MAPELFGWIMTVIFLAAALYTLVFIVFCIVTNPRVIAKAQKFKSMEEVETAVLKEKTYLGLSEIKTQVIVKPLDSSYCQVEAKYGNDRSIWYELIIDPRYTNSACIKHELYHVYTGALFTPEQNKLFLYRLWSILSYWFYHEPLAHAYVLWGWKI